jgi:hypothetical protein
MTISAVQPTGIASVDQSIAAAQAAIATSRTAFPTGGTVRGTNDIVEISPQTLAKQALAQAAASRAAANGSTGFAPASMAAVLVKTNIESMLLQDFLAVNGLGNGSANTNPLRFEPDPARGGFDLYL